MQGRKESPAATVVPFDEVRTPEQFVAAMRQRKAMSGLTYLELERRAAAVGDELSPEAALVGVDGMPGERLVAAFVRACGDAPEEVAAWVAVHRRISAVVPEPGATPPPERAGNSWISDLLPPVFVHARRPVRVFAVAVAALLLATVAAVWVTSGPFEEYGVFPSAAPEGDDEADDEAAEATTSPTTTRNTSKPPPRRPAPTQTRTPAAAPTPAGTVPDRYDNPYPPPSGDDRGYPVSPSPTEEEPEVGRPPSEIICDPVCRPAS